MKKILLLMGALGLFNYAQAQTSETQTFIYDELEYTVTGENTVGLSDACDLPEVIIPETVTYEGKTYTVTSIMDHSFNYNDVTTKVVMPNTITEIEYCGMYGAEAVTEMQISENLTKLGDYAFAYMESIPSITIPDGVTEIPGSCFYMNKSMKTLSLPDGIKSIGSGCFYKAGLTEFTFPEACDSLGNNLFQYAQLTKVTFNANIRVMGEGIFRQCESLSTVDWSAVTKLKKLPDFLFDQCTSLTGTITIPACVESLGVGVFGSTGVSEFAVAAGNTALTAIDGILYSADKSLLYAFPPKSAMTEVTVADGCLGISGGAFDGATAVTKVTLPDGIRAFDDNAFLNCKALTEINFPESLVYMGTYALAGSGLTEVTLPEGMNIIYEGLLAQCPNLTKVTIPSGIEIIDMYAFRASEKLANVTCLGAIPAELNYYESYDYPFYQISEDAVLHVPAGTADAYRSAGWTDGFSEVVDDMPAIFVPTTFNPADGAELKTLEKILITFPEAVTIAERNPEAKFYKGSELTGDLIEPDSNWLATDEDDNTVGIVGLDYDSYNQSFSLEAGEEYTFVIPAGTFQNAAGDKNQKIVLHFVGYTPVAITYESIDPADGSELEQLGAIEINFGQNITSIDPNPDIVLRKGNAETGEEIQPDDRWMMNANGQTLTVFAADMDGYTTPIALDGGENYYLNIPAGIIRNDNGDENAAFTIHYVGKQTVGINDAIADNCMILTSGNTIDIRLGSLENCDIRIFNTTGQLLDSVYGASGNVTVDAPTNGILLVNIKSSNDNRTFKVIIK